VRGSPARALLLTRLWPVTNVSAATVVIDTSSVSNIDTGNDRDKDSDSESASHSDSDSDSCTSTSTVSSDSASHGGTDSGNNNNNNVDTGTAPVINTNGDAGHLYRLASISKPMTAWAALIAVEEGLLSLNTPIGQPGCTLRHLLAHAGGYGFDGPDPITAPERKRIYSNTGIELAADAVAAAAGMPFAQYLAEAVFEPLGMDSTELRGSPAHGVWSTCDDLIRFTIEMAQPRLISGELADTARGPAFADLSGVIPGLGSYSPCPWGLGVEIRGDKQPHWTGRSNSPQSFGHFGGAGTLCWVDPGAVRDRVVICIALTDRSFDEWSSEALLLWPELSDAVIGEARG
jgi:Beta-lactamase